MEANKFGGQLPSYSPPGYMPNVYVVERINVGLYMHICGAVSVHLSVCFSDDVSSEVDGSRGC